MELVVLLVVAAFMAVIGIGIGMLVAPRLDRWAAPKPPAESTGADPAVPGAPVAPSNERSDDDA
jgi:hypothetical protein